MLDGALAHGGLAPDHRVQPLSLDLLTTGWAGVCCVRRWSAQDVNGTFEEGPNTGGEGLMP